MKDLMIEPVLDPVSEARRYVENAEKTLSENGKYDPETNCYQDPKYVRAAGHYLWSSVLIILDAVFKIKTKQRPHPDVKDYRNAIFKRDKKLLTLVNAAYIVAHISMGYDGAPSRLTCQDGIRLANNIIDRCEMMLKNKGVIRMY